MLSDAVINNEWHVVYRSSDIAEGEVRPIRLLGQDLVLWRANGRAMVWLDRCIHRGAPFTKGRVLNGQLVCPYHGWRYDCEGKCTLIPSQPDLPIPRRARATTYHCEERYGFVWVCLGKPTTKIPILPEWDDEAFEKVHTGPYPIASSGPRIVENVVDVTHFPFVHDDMLGQEGDPDAIGEYEVHTRDDGIHSSPITVFQPAGDHRRVPVQSIYKFWIPRPLMSYLMKQLDGDRCFSHFMAATPVETDRSLLWVLTSANFDKIGARERITERNDQIFGQDVPIIESQDPTLIPPEIAQELHVRADKLSVVYRRWLNEMNANEPT